MISYGYFALKNSRDGLVILGNGKKRSKSLRAIKLDSMLMGSGVLMGMIIVDVYFDDKKFAEKSIGNAMGYLITFVFATLIIYFFEKRYYIKADKNMGTK